MSLHTHTVKDSHTQCVGGRRCSLLSWWTTPVSLRLSATTFTSCVLVNNSIRPFLVSRWLVVGEVVFYVQTNCWNNLPSSLRESGSPVGGSVKNSIVGKCHREPSVLYLTKWTRKKTKTKKQPLSISSTLSAWQQPEGKKFKSRVWRLCSVLTEDCQCQLFTIKYAILDLVTFFHEPNMNMSLREITLLSTPSSGCWTFRTVSSSFFC